MEPFAIGDIWYGKEGTPYEGVTATIRDITKRYVQVSFNRTVYIDEMLIGGDALTHKQFRLNFDPGQQLSLW